MTGTSLRARPTAEERRAAGRRFDRGVPQVMAARTATCTKMDLKKIEDSIMVGTQSTMTGLVVASQCGMGSNKCTDSSSLSARSGAYP